MNPWLQLLIGALLSGQRGIAAAIGQGLVRDAVRRLQ